MELLPEKNKVYKEEVQDNLIPSMEKSEFENKRVPLDGIELLLDTEKVPDELGKRMDHKNIQEVKKNETKEDFNDDLTDLDEIISDAESIQSTLKENPFRKKDRIQRKKKFLFKKPFQKKNNSPSNILRSKEFFQKPLTRPLDVPNDDISDVESGHSHHTKDEDIYDDNEKSASDESVYSDEGSFISETMGSSSVPKWRSPSDMSKDEIVSEKMELLYRYGRLEGNGYKSGLELNMRTPLETLRAEISKLERMRQVQRSIRTQRKLLISFASGVEYVNKRYNPYKFSLDGWSGDVLENVGDYDEVFEELHDKYKDSVEMAPELKLLTMVGGSGLMFHLSNTLFKSSTPQLNDILQNNPDIMAQIQKEALHSMAAKNANDPIFGMMMNGVQEKQRQSAQQPQWTGRPGYAPPRTSAQQPMRQPMQQPMQQPMPSNMQPNPNVRQVPQGQGIVDQNIMKGPQGFDDILSQLNPSNMSQTKLMSDTEEPDQVREVQTKEIRPRPQTIKRTPPKKRKPTKKNIIDLD